MLFHGKNRTCTGRHDIVAMLVLVPLVSAFLSLGAMGGARSLCPTAPVTEVPFEGSEENSEPFAQLAVAVQRRTTPLGRLDVSTGNSVAAGNESRTIDPAACNLTRAWYAPVPVPLFLQKRAFLI